MAIKKYSKVKFTLRKELIIILSAIVVLVVATILLNLPNKEEKFLAKWQENGSQITENHLYEEVTFDELKDILNSNSANEVSFVYFATPSNADSVTYFDQILNFASTFESIYEIDKIYIVDSAFALEGNREEDSDFDSKLKAIEENFKDASGNTIKLDSVPNFWLFNGNVLVDSANNYEENEVINWNKALLGIFTNAAPTE